MLACAWSVSVCLSVHSSPQRPLATLSLLSLSSPRHHHRHHHHWATATYGTVREPIPAIKPDISCRFTMLPRLSPGDWSRMWRRRLSRQCLTLRALNSEPCCGAGAETVLVLCECREASGVWFRSYSNTLSVSTQGGVCQPRCVRRGGASVSQY